MKKKVLNLQSLLCIVLAVALAVTAVALFFTDAKTAALEEELQLMSVELAELKLQNTELQAQLNASGILPEAGSQQEDIADYSVFDVADWSVQDGNLTVTGSVYVGLFSDTLSAAHLELRKGDEVLQTVALELWEGEAEDVYEAELNGASFRLPALSDDEELQLWLVVQPANGSAVSSFGAGWYQVGDELMMVTG
jgi:hypothetical protein